MKPTPAFKMKKQYKRYAANFVNNHTRRSYMRAMISAQLAEEAADKQPLNRKDKE